MIMRKDKSSLFKITRFQILKDLSIEVSSIDVLNTSKQRETLSFYTFYHYPILHLTQTHIDR